MKITFLGTGTSQGIPLIGCKCRVCRSPDARDKRLRTSIMIEVKGNVFVIDSGPDFRQQMLREKVKRLSAVIFTHEHFDHISGLDEVRAFNYITKKNVDIYATEHVQQNLKRVFAYIFDGTKYPGIPKLKMHTISNKNFSIGGVKFIPVLAFHYRLPVLGFRIGNFTYITDANYIPPDEMKKIEGSEIIVLNALRKRKHISHFTLSQAVGIIKNLKPRKAYLTHLSHQIGTHGEVGKALPGFIRPAYDRLKINL